MIHYYYGDGKGKTTASMGLAVRALGRDRKVLVTHFFKDGINKSGEDFILSKIDNCVLKTLEFKKWVDFNNVLDSDKEKVNNFFQEVKEIVSNFKPELIVFDEILYALNYELIDIDEFLSWIKTMEEIELVLTGRPKIEALIKVADYVSNIKAEKHPFESNIDAREGIEF